MTVAKQWNLCCESLPAGEWKEKGEGFTSNIMGRPVWSYFTRWWFVTRHCVNCWYLLSFYRALLPISHTLFPAQVSLLEPIKPIMFYQKFWSLTNIPFKFDFEILLECEGTQDKKKKKRVKDYFLWWLLILAQFNIMLNWVSIEAENKSVVTSLSLIPY